VEPSPILIVTIVLLLRLCFWGLLSCFFHELCSCFCFPCRPRLAEHKEPKSTTETCRAECHLVQRSQPRFPAGVADNNYGGCNITFSYPPDAAGLGISKVKKNCFHQLQGRHQLCFRPRYISSVVSYELVTASTLVQTVDATSPRAYLLPLSTESQTRFLGNFVFAGSLRK
jgi:hypothetical protein